MEEAKQAESAYERIARRSAREQAYGVTCYEYQAMLEVDHADWPVHVKEMAQRDRDGIGYTPEEVDFAITLIHQWVRELGVKQVRQALTDTIAQRADARAIATASGVSA